ncbi:AAA domain-containing protein [Chloroflexia bacterium SDU3-3]|nr:AAA domain-containing protein [Chloroflexia bacterium SDU3-3]
MSCEGKLGTACATMLGGGGSSLAQAFGGDAAEATAILEETFRIARSQAAGRDRPAGRVAELKAKAADQAATDATVAFFTYLRDTHQVPPGQLPAHGRGRDGVPLPKLDACHGYAAVWEAVQAAASGRPLPGLAAEVRQRRRERQITALRADTWSGGGMRCTGCGQFASALRAHLCPQTATPAALSAALVRSLRVPDTAYPPQALASLVAQAKDEGVVSMRHAVTGEAVSVTLDGLAVAIKGGYMPHAWTGLAAVAATPDGRAVPVLSMANLTPAPEATTGLAAAAMASGQVLSADTPVLSAARPLPERLAQTVATATETTVTGGEDYTQGRFLGTEYRKKSALGQPVEIDGLSWGVGQRATGQQYWAAARHAGLAPQKGVTIGVGRTLPGAVQLLADPTTRVATTAAGQTQVYAGGDLLAVYDAATGTLGDTAGTPNASSAQMAALIAHRALHPETAYDQGLAMDLEAMIDGRVPTLQAVDAAYLAITHGPLDTTHQLRFGAQVGTARCPQCGQFMGDAHVCPHAAPSEPVASPPPVAADQTTTAPPPPVATNQGDGQPAASVAAAVEPVASALQAAMAEMAASDPATFAAQVQDYFATHLAPGGAPPLDAATVASALAAALPAPAAPLDAEALASALAAALPPQLDPAALRDAIRDGIAAVPAPQVTVTLPEAQAAPAATVQLQLDHDALAGAFRAAMQQAATTLAQPLPPGTVADPPPAPAGPTARPPRTGRMRPVDLPLTGQEHILASVRLPAPDPYLRDVPAAVGGQRAAPLEEFIPDLDPDYAISADTERVLRSISAMMQAGQRVSGTAKRACMSFGLYGKPGTGKNTLPRQLAASILTIDAEGNETQGMHYAEVNILPDSTADEMIGAVVLEPDGRGGTRSAVRLGKIGLAAAMGSVVCVNEIVRNPKLATALQSILEDGEILISSPEAGMVRIPVHPATTMFLTWNPGNEGDPDRPAQAPLSRITTFPMDKATENERAERAMRFVTRFSTGRTPPSAAESTQDLGQRQEARRQEILRTKYQIPQNVTPAPEELRAAVKLVTDIEQLADAGVGAKQIGLASATSTAPGDRQLARFLLLGKAVGWRRAADMFKICCDQGEDFAGQWALVENRMDACFGTLAPRERR